MSNKQLSTRLANLSPEQREILLKRLQQQKKTQQRPPNKQRIAALDRSAGKFPLSFAQQRLWFLDQLESGSGSYNIAAAIKLTGELDVEALRNALETIIHRHESLRTIFVQERSETFQVILEPGCCVLPMEDLSTLKEAQRETVLRQRVRAEACAPFDLGSGPLLRTTLLRCSKDQHIMLITMHHIISDGWSTRVLIKELSTLYSAFKQGKPAALPPLAIQYADYAEWQRNFLQGETLSKQLEYWRKQLHKVPVLELPTDYPRQPVQSVKGSHYAFQLDKQWTDGIRKISQNSGATVFMTLLAAYQVLLSRYSSQTDICVGSPIANRTRTEIEPLIGFFVNSLALRSDLSNDPTFSSLLKQVEKVTLDAYSNQDIPFEQLVEELIDTRDPSHNPLFQVFFSLTDGRVERNLQLSGLDAEFIDANIEAAKFELSLNCTEYADHFVCEFEYNTDLYEKSTIEQLSKHFITLLECIINNADLPLSQLELMDSAERRQLLRDWNNTQQDIPQVCIHQLFEQQAERSPSRIAVQCGDQRLTYRALNERSNRLARYLIEQGVQPGDRIGICLEPSIDILCAVLASIKTGAAYIPMDGNYPKDRLSHMLENANIQLLLTHSSLAASLPEDACKLIMLDQLKAQTDALDHSNLNLDISPDDLLYVVYTSGSTGKPKGAGVRHRNESNLLHWYTDNYQISEQDKVLVISAFGFDLTQKNLFAALTRGGQVVFPDSSHYDQRVILNTIREQRISFLNCAPSAFYPLVELNDTGSALNSLRTVLFGGEPIRMENMQPWIDQPDFNCQIVNMYGPTECTDIAATFTIDNASSYLGKTIPIGRPNDNVQLYVLDENNQPVPIGVVGELCIGGAGVGIGYINNQQLTDERFFPNPFGDGKLYRTGDLVRYRNDGLLDFVSRIDGQVKIRGFRIELGEIEAQLLRHPAIREAIVAPCDTASASTVLVGYIIVNKENNGDAPTNAELRSHLKQSLPDYMVPSAFVTVDSIPLTPNGKVNRKELPVPDLQTCTTAAFVAPESQTEKGLAGIWCEVLQLAKVGIHDNFFEIGGHSLLATQLVTRIREVFQLELPLRTLFELTTIAEIAEIINTLQPDSVDDACSDTTDGEEFEEGVL
jgi:amino acid adenylation domain-containing protein